MNISSTLHGRHVRDNYDERTRFHQFQCYLFFKLDVSCKFCFALMKLYLTNIEKCTMLTGMVECEIVRALSKVLSRTGQKIVTVNIIPVS